MMIRPLAGLSLLAAVGFTQVGCGEPNAAAAASAKARPINERSQAPAREQYSQTLEGVHEAYDVVLTNLANAQTPGYQALRPIFEDSAGDQPGQGNVMRPIMHRDPSPGKPVLTGRWLDVAINGGGYFIIDDPSAGGVDGLAYSRAGQLYISHQGALVAGSPTGPRLEPIVIFPDDFRDIRIAEDGTVSVLTGTAEPRWTAVGLIHLARFANDAGLNIAPGAPGAPGSPGSSPATISGAAPGAAADRFVATAESGPPLVDTPGGLGLGMLQHKHLEGSNVDIHAELAELNQLKSWGESIAAGLGVEAGFRSPAPAAAAWDARRTVPAAADAGASLSNVQH